jgi:hypothetical protein
VKAPAYRAPEADEPAVTSASGPRWTRPIGRLALVTVLLAGCFLALAAASIGRTIGDTWSFLSNQRSSYADLTRADPNVVPEFQALLPVTAANFFLAHVRRGDRFYLQVQEGPFIAGVDYPTAVRTFARFELLPAIAVTDPAQADVVLSVGADPRALGLDYVRIDRAGDGRYAAARVRN